MLTRLMLDLPLWLLVAFGALFAAGVWPWMLYVSLAAWGVVVIGVLVFAGRLLRGQPSPLPSPLARALGRRRR